MLELIQCTNCSKPVGNLSDVYDYVSHLIKRDYQNADLPGAADDRIQWDPRWRVEMGDLLDLLKVERECCRVVLLSKIKISKIR